MRPIILVGNGRPAPRAKPVGLADVVRDWPADQTARLARLPDADFARIEEELAEVSVRVAVARRRRSPNGRRH